MKDNNNTEPDRKWCTEHCMPWYEPFFISRALSLCLSFSLCPFLSNSFFTHLFRFSAMFAISVKIHEAQRKANYMFTFLFFTLKQWTTLRLIYFENTLQTKHRTLYQFPSTIYKHIHFTCKLGYIMRSKFISFLEFVYIRFHQMRTNQTSITNGE